MFRATFGVFRSFAGKMAILLVIFLVFPLLVYIQLESADRVKNDLLLQSIQREGEVIVRSLLPVLETFETAPPEALQNGLDRLRLQDRTIKLLARPDLPGAAEHFYYIAASPKVSRKRLDLERSSLLATGVFDRLAETCAADRPLATRFVNPEGEAEILSSLVPVRAGDTCFVVVTSHTDPAFLETALGQPFWRTETLQIAALMYAMMAILVVWLFADAWFSLQRFRTTARMIRTEGPGAGSFSTRNRVPELATVAEDFDHLVEHLDRSRRFIREAAEETAHALKAPLAVIAQAVEPLKRVKGVEDNENAKTSVALIEASIARSDAMISATRDLERMVAESMERGRQPLNLKPFLDALGEAYRTSLQSRDVTVDVAVHDDAYVRAGEEALETIFENILDNAASFSPPESRIALSMRTNGAWAVAEIEDEGPGVDPRDTEAIFERYVSMRHAQQGAAGQQKTMSFGLGLWIVRRNVEALGGSVAAANREPHGLRVIVRLPLAQ